MAVRVDVSRQENGSAKAGSEQVQWSKKSCPSPCVPVVTLCTYLVRLSSGSTTIRIKDTQVACFGEEDIGIRPFGDKAGVHY